MKNNVVKFANRHKKSVATGLATVGTLALVGAASASGVDEVATSVTTQMTTIKNTAMTILASVAGIAIVLFGAIYGWRYGKKVFSIISK